MIKRVEKTILDHKMINAGDKVLVALSGGADSVCLAFILNQIKERLGFSLSAAHINHCLRGEESDRDEVFVREFCRKLGIPLFVGRADIKKEAKKSGESIELCARRIRYQLLGSFAEGGKIATAHTNSDSCETVLFNLARGTGIKGLCGIPPVRDNIIRPLINCTREDIESFNRANALDFVTDSTNLTDDYSRNMIRHNVSPVMKKLNPGYERSVGRMTGELLEIYSFIDFSADQLLSSSKSDGGYDVGKLSLANRAVLSHAVRKAALSETGFYPDEFHTSCLCSIVSKGKGRLQLAGGCFAKVYRGKLCFSSPDNGETADFTSDFKDGEYDLPLCKMTVKTVKKQYVNSLLLNTTFYYDKIDYNKISGDAVLRTKKEGDSVSLLNRPRKTLKKLFNESGVPCEDRNRLGIISDEKGVIYVEGFGIDKRVLPDENTKQIILVGIQKKQI